MAARSQVRNALFRRALESSRMGETSTTMVFVLKISLTINRSGENCARGTRGVSSPMLVCACEGLGAPEVVRKDIGALKSLREG